jgi:hypothetical protein
MYMQISLINWTVVGKRKCIGPIGVQTFEHSSLYRLRNPGPSILNTPSKLCTIFSTLDTYWWSADKIWTGSLNPAAIHIILLNKQYPGLRRMS